ncbi:hypothetical protein BAE44_0019286 [Dichanthelium oligosanthes]|uniref:Uncharacterized protein n=1 Tax=Dichanthelium oligosanthes TaxID=888268 RepID=A0A1E5V3G3_9POAL|nr:hypothetical protein BAE44_0019286 [Dichanthelium oligosanthes]
MEGSGGSPLTQLPPTKDVDESTLALTKRARKRSRYLSPPYTDTDAQAEEVAGEEEEPPNFSAAEALSALQLRAAALWQGQGVDAGALRFLALYRNRKRATTGDPHAAAGDGSHEDGSNKPPLRTASVGHTMLNLSAGPAMPRPDGGSPAPALATKKKNPHAPAVKQQDGPMENAAALEQAADGHICASQSSGSAVDATYGVANPATPEKKKKKKKYNKRMKSAEAEAAYSCAGTPGAFGLPPVPKLQLTDIRNNLEKMISSLNRRSKATAVAANSPEEAMPAMGNLVGEMQGLLAKVDKMLQGPSATAHHG